MLSNTPFRKCDYRVELIDQQPCAALVREHHYARGCSHVSTYRFGLIGPGDRLVGAAMWMPPTKRAALTVDRRWTAVLSLSRMAVVPGVPKNACSFLLGRSVRAMVRDGEYHSFVTYADERMEHTGGVYLASGWIPAGHSQPTAAWLDKDGRQVAQLSTKTRTKAQMEELGLTMVGRFRKRKFVLYPGRDVTSKLLRLGAHIAWLQETMRNAV